MLWTPPLVEFRITSDLWLVVPPSGGTCRDYQRGWLVVEEAGRVTVSECGDLDRPSESVMRRWTIDTTDHVSVDPVDLVKAVIKESLDAITAEYVEKGWDIDETVQLTSAAVEQNQDPSELIGAMCDALREWDNERATSVEIALSIELVTSASKNASAMDKLKAAADHVQMKIIDVVKSADPLTTRIPFLPSLVAVPYALANRPGSFRDRLWSLTNTFESAVRYLATVALVPIAGESNEARLRQLSDQSNTTRPTSGVYVRILRERLDNLRPLLANVAASLQDSSGRRTNLGRFLFDEFPRMRNDFIGHSGEKAEAAYVEPCLRLWENTEGLLRSLTTDGHNTMPVLQQAVDVGKNGTYKYTLVELRGDSVAPPSARLVSDQPLDRGNVYLLHSPTKEFFRVDPLIVYEMCPECKLEEAFFLDQFDAKAPEWFTYRGGHRTRSRASRSLG